MIILDSREENKIEKGLLARGLIVKREFLEIGDLLLSDDICIERKTGNDFLSSIRDRRIWSQAQNLSQYKSPIICIITGNIWRDFYYSQSNWIHKSFIGAISSLILGFKISVITLDTDEEFIDFVAQIEKRLQEEGKTERPKPLMRKAETLQERKENCLSAIQGVGIATSKKLLEKFGSINKIANASENELEQIEGLGKKTIKNILETLN